MGMSPKRKLSVAAIGLAVMALIADKALFAPAEVAAGITTDEFTLPPGESAATPQDQLQAMNARAKEISVGLRLRAFSQQHPLDRAALPDPFLPAWIDPLGGRGRTVAASAGDAESREFARNHRLTAVMGSGPDGYAVINGSVVRIGQRVAQFKLVAIRERTATLRASDGRSVELALQGDVPISRSANEQNP